MPDVPCEQEGSFKVSFFLNFCLQLTINRARSRDDPMRCVFCKAVGGQRRKTDGETHLNAPPPAMMLLMVPTSRVYCTRTVIMGRRDWRKKGREMKDGRKNEGIGKTSM